MSTDGSGPEDPQLPDENPPDGAPGGGNGDAGQLIEASIEDELKESYLTYAMSVIVSRARPDVRDGLKPSQRRIHLPLRNADGVLQLA